MMTVLNKIKALFKSRPEAKAAEKKEVEPLKAEARKKKTESGSK